MTRPNGRDGIVVLGAPRSGTTLLRRLLNAHPSIACPPETNLLNAACRFLEEYDSARGLSIGVLSGLAFSGIEPDETVARVREFVFGIFDELRAAAGKPLWAEKTAFDAFHVDSIRRLCAERCRFVVLYRNGLDVACSIQELTRKMGTYAPELHAYVRAEPTPLVAFAQAWSDVTERLMALTDECSVRTCAIRYEDLVAEPASELNRLFEFLEEPCDVDALVREAMDVDAPPGLGDWKTYGRAKVTSVSVGRWRSVDAPTLMRMIEAARGPLAALGYLPPEAELTALRRPSQGEAQRRYQMELMAGRMRRSEPPEGREP